MMISDNYLERNISKLPYMGKSRWKIFKPRRSINKTEIESCLAGKIHRHSSSIVVIASDVIKNLETVKDFTSNLTKRGYSGVLCWGKKCAFYTQWTKIWKKKRNFSFEDRLCFFSNRIWKCQFYLLRYL